MGEYTALFERAAAHYSEPQLSTEGLLLRRDRKQRNQRAAAGVLGVAVFALAAVGFVRLLGSERTPASDPRSPFEGTWVSTTDTDGGTQTMTVLVSADGAVEITVTDDVATVCSGTSSTMTGTGRIEGGTQLVIPAPVYTCDDGSEPETLSGPPLEEQLRDWTLFLDPDTDTLSDGLGGVWLREGAEEDPEEPLEGLGPGLEAPWDPSRFGGTWESTAGDTGFLGTWESTDIDGSSLLLGIRVSEDPSGGYEVLLLDGAETCPSFFGPITSDGPITMTGIGRVEGREMAFGSQTWFCEAAGGPDVVSGDASLQIAAAHTPLVHDLETDTLVGPTGRPPGAPSWMQGRGVVWHRRPPGSDPIGVPFWGVWPQSSLEEARVDPVRSRDESPVPERPERGGLPAHDRRHPLRDGLADGHAACPERPIRHLGGRRLDAARPIGGAGQRPPLPRAGDSAVRAGVAAHRGRAGGRPRSVPVRQGGGRGSGGVPDRGVLPAPPQGPAPVRHDRGPSLRAVRDRERGGTRMAGRGLPGDGAAIRPRRGGRR